MTLSSKRFELVLWMLTPAFISLMLLIICFIPKHIWGVGYVIPLLPIIPIFYWGKLQASEIPFWFVALIGLITDALNATPLGLTSLLYLLYLGIVHSQSKYISKEGFIVIWGYFITLSALVSCLQWLIITMLNGQIYAFTPALIQFLLTAAIYPLFHQIFYVLSEHIKQRRWIILHG